MLSQSLVGPASADAMDERWPVPLVLCGIAVSTTTAQIASWSFPTIKGLYGDCLLGKGCDINEKNKNSHFFQSRCSVGHILTNINWLHNDVIKWKHFPRYWPFVREIHWSLVNSPHITSDAGLWWFLWSASEQTVGQTTETPVIWDAVALIMQCKRLYNKDSQTIVLIS